MRAMKISESSPFNLDSIFFDVIMPATRLAHQCDETRREARVSAFWKFDRSQISAHQYPLAKIYVRSHLLHFTNFSYSHVLRLRSHFKKGIEFNVSNSAVEEYTYYNISINIAKLPA